MATDLSGYPAVGFDGTNFPAVWKTASTRVYAARITPALGTPHAEFVVGRDEEDCADVIAYFSDAAWGDTAEPFAGQVIPALGRRRRLWSSPEESHVTMSSHEVDYRIYGDDMQFVEIELDPGETVIAEAGAMMYVTEGIQWTAVMGDGSEPDQGMWGKLKGAGKRAISGESLFLTHFTNEGGGKQIAAFAASYPGKIIPLNLATVGGRLICQKDAFLCAAKGTKVGIVFNRKLGAGLFGGEGFILQDLQGDGNVFVHAGGTIVEKHLSGETLRVDTGCLVAFEPNIEYDIQRAGKLKSQIFGGEGLFVATLTGVGRVWLQSLPFSRLADRIAPFGGGAREGEGSVIGGLSNIFER